MQEPGFNTHYLSDMKLWVTHSQFIVEHINAMTTLAREHTMLTPDLAQRYLESCEIAIQRCQQRPEYDRPRLRRCQYSGVAGHAVTWLIEHSGTTFTAHHWPSEHHAHHFVDGGVSVRITVSG